MTDQTITAPAPAKARRGCFFYGCITCLVLALIVVLGIIAGAYFVKKKVNSLVENYTDSQPMSLPAVQMSKDDVAQLKKRLDAFEQSVRDHKPTEPLVLTSDEINALLEDSTLSQQFKGKVHVSLDGDKVKADLSLPLESFGFKMYKGRYLNGSGTFDVSLHGVVVDVTPDTINVKGHPLPDAYMQAFRNQNFAASLNKDSNASPVLAGIQEIEVKDSKLIVIPKSEAGGAEASPK